METQLIAQRLGEGVEELTIVSWLKQVGEPVAEMEPIVEVETDKVVTEFPSPVAGTLLKIDVPAGETVKVGDSMGSVGIAGEEPEAKPAQEKPANGEPAVQVEPTSPIPAQHPESGDKNSGLEIGEGSKRNFISPLVRKMAAENQVDLSRIPGTGEGGRITKADVTAYLEQAKQAPAAAATSTLKPSTGNIPSPTVVTPSVAPAKPTLQISPDLGKLIPHTSSRRQIAERMVQSKLTSPHVLTVMEADMSAILAHRKQHKQAYAEKGINLTLTAYFIAAIVEGLRSMPKLNASWTDEGLFIFNSINVGMAVALGENGLIVPVIHNAQDLSLEGLARQINDLSDRARKKRLLPDDVRGGTFSLTNYGTGGSLFASPVINQPQLGILGTGAMQKRVVVLTDADGNDAIAIRPMIYLSLVFDHRAIDGEAGDAFLSKVKQTLENWR